MTQDNNKGYQKKANSIGGSSKNSNYNKYKKPNTQNKNSNYSQKNRKPSQTTGSSKGESSKSGKSDNYKSNKNYYKNKNYKKKNYNSRRKKYSRNPALETIEEIKGDIRRIEKEIRLEIEEIKSLKV